jgi:hypothetical protein
MVESPNHTEPQHYPLANFPKLATAWTNLTTDIKWRVPKGLYWSVGNEFTQSSQQLVRILCSGHHLAFFLLAPLQTRQKIRSFHI